MKREKIVHFSHVKIKNACGIIDTKKSCLREGELFSMYQPGDKVLYGVHGVCCVLAPEERTVDRKKNLYYVLQPLEQPGTRYYVPANNPIAAQKLRRLLTAAELNALLHSDTVRQESWIADEGQRKQRYRELINSGDRAALLSMIRSLHTHKQQQAEAGRKFHLCDENFLRDAEKLLSAEFSLILNIPPEKVGEYIIDVLSE